MKARQLALTLALLLTVPVLMGAGARIGGMSDDERTIRRNIERYYFEGVRNSDTAVAHRAFHPEAQMFFIRDNRFAQRSIADWLLGIEQRKPSPPQPDSYSRRILSVDVTGTSAVAKLQLDYPDALITDYMSLLKVDGDWVIVNKIFHRGMSEAKTSSRQ